MPVFMSSIREKEQKIYSHNNRFQLPRTVRLTTFDPNITDSVGFLDLGLPAWMAKNILKYRNKGGKFRRAEDLPESIRINAGTIRNAPTLHSYSYARKAQSIHFASLPAKIEEDTLNFFEYAAGTQ